MLETRDQIWKHDRYCGIVTETENSRDFQNVYMKLTDYFDSIKQDYEKQLDECKQNLLKYQKKVPDAEITVDIFYRRKLLQQLKLKLAVLNNVNKIGSERSSECCV